ncbi:MAG: Lrp/AsnC family transcriptional regulator [Woeseiaceae bacterium]|jgi:Lrp/AsnC family transcriptional regulator|tara:strand:- start:523 stop:990 length:468 start_codon:yes stop_codon:yes gene_type:complete
MDQRDIKILEAIQNDATLTVTQIAQTLNISTSTCWRRIQALEEAGVISARVTLLDQKKVGLNLTVYSAIRTHKHTSNWFNGFNKMVSSNPNIMEVHRLSGDIDYLIRAVVPDMNSYDEMYKEMISKVDLYDVSSSFSMETIKYTTSLPLKNLPLS